jgi:hypothetical protein
MATDPTSEPVIDTAITANSTATEPKIPIVPAQSVTFPKLPNVGWVATYSGIELATAGIFFWLYSVWGRGKPFQPQF